MVAPPTSISEGDFEGVEFVSVNAPASIGDFRFHKRGYASKCPRFLNLDRERREIGPVIVVVFAFRLLQERHGLVCDRGDRGFPSDLDEVVRDHDLDQKFVPLFHFLNNKPPASKLSFLH